MSARLLWFSSLLLALPACGGSGSSGDEVTEVGGPCDAVVKKHRDEGMSHVQVGSTVSYKSNPPTSGNHYPVWLAWESVFLDPIEREYYVHNLEHGGVVLQVRCSKDECPEVYEQLRVVGDSLAADRACAPPVRVRWVVVADPQLPAEVQVAASAWTFSYTAACVDEDSIRSFAAEHMSGGPEPIMCAQGSIRPQ